VAAANALHLHRNTLVYRLEKIERLVGWSWRDHRAMLSLYMASLAEQLEPSREDGSVKSAHSSRA
jgi:carbohydrate diacid regulator